MYRDLCSETFFKVIKKVWGSSFSEKQLKELWLGELKKNKDLFPGGWYVPPPDGISILLATQGNPQRLNYDNLREEKNWPQKGSEPGHCIHSKGLDLLPPCRA